MKQISLFVFLTFFSINNSYSQEQDTAFSSIKNGISKPSILSTHPFGIFFSRIQGNFKSIPTRKHSLNISLESGNVWGTPIKTYIPNDESIRNEARKYEWHQAQYFFDEESLDAKSFELQIDGVIKGLRLNTNFRLGNQHELNLGLRFFMLTKGKAPFTILTSDKFVENFHNKIAGGDDPFDRGVFGHNKAQIKYLDRNGSRIELTNNDFFIGGLETTYYYYPKALSTDTFYTNFGAHFGTNLSKYNSSIDFGLSSNITKKILMPNENFVQIGLGLGALRKGVLNMKQNNVDFGTNNFIGHLESALEYNFISKKRTIHSFGVDFYFQTSLNKKDELEYIIPIRNPDAHKAWGHGVTNLYKNNNYWTFLYSFTKKVTTTFYLQQDFTVNNNPDIQTGVSIAFNLIK